MRNFPLGPVAGLMILSALGGVAFGATGQVVQRNRAFLPKEIEVRPGDTVRISNDDEFSHEVYVDGEGMKFESGEKEPGQFSEIGFPRAGTFEVLCHIHPKMRLRVTVK